jgi:hypothetical protein
MKRKRTMLWIAALAMFCALLVGYFALQSGADEAVGTHPNDKANHHPKHATGSSQ